MPSSREGNTLRVTAATGLPGVTVVNLNAKGTAKAYQALARTGAEG